MKTPGIFCFNPKPRPFYLRTLFLGATLTVFLFLYIQISPSGLPSYPSLFSDRQDPPRQAGKCSPESYSDGHWEYKPRTNLTKMTDNSQALLFAGFEGCASSREYYWHLGAGDEHFARFPDVDSWEWVTNDGCSVRSFNPADVIRDLVERGGWLLLGDSITEGHFFSLSCSLFPHVIATPDYIANPYWDRAWPQHLYLNPSSPLISSLSLPPGFSIKETPLVTFRRTDLLLTQPALVSLYSELHPDAPADFRLFGDEQVWDIEPQEYLDLFFGAPPLNYATMVVNTAGHWTTTGLLGLRDESKKKTGYGIDKVVEFFEQAMRAWADEMQQRLWAETREQRLAAHRNHQAAAGNPSTALKTNSRRRKRQILVRAYLPGHDGCHNHKKPWMGSSPMVPTSYNWGYIGDFNRAFERAVAAPEFPDIYYLGIDGPGLARPDAHVTSDCLHMMAGAGVLEGWSHYIWHFIGSFLDDDSSKQKSG